MPQEKRNVIDGCVYHASSDLMQQYSVNFLFNDDLMGSFNLVQLGQRDQRDIRVYGEKGYLQGCLEDAKLTYHIYEIEEPTVLTWQYWQGHGGGDMVIIEEFLNALLLKRQISCTLEDGINASIASFACEESRIIKKPISICWANQML